MGFPALEKANAGVQSSTRREGKLVPRRAMPSGRELERSHRQEACVSD